MELEMRRRIKIIRIDEDGEYKKWIKDYLKDYEIKYEVTTYYSSKQNDIIKYVNRIILEWTKVILADMEFPKTLWMEIVSIIIYLKNRSSISSLDDKISYKI